jgi:hypothetical protein
MHVASQLNGSHTSINLIELIECVQGLLMSKGSPSLKVLLSLFLSYHSTTIHSIGRILRNLILIGIMLTLIFLVDESKNIVGYFIGLKLKKEPNGHNLQLLTCHLVLVLAAALQ